MSKKYIRIKLAQEGIHRWEDCPFEEVSFLRDYHRHIFHFEIELEVFELDRDIEFIILKRTLKNYIADMLKDKVPYSCETMADKVCDFLLGKFRQRDCSVFVYEDNENGGGVRYAF